MQLKGQIEIMAILVFVIIGIVAAYFVLQPGGPGSIISGVGTTEQSKLIRDSVMNLIRTGTLENINKIYDNGGYLDASQVTNVEYGGLTVPIWQACSDNMAPDVKKQLENGLRQYITENLESNEDFYGKGAEFTLNRMRVDVNIFDGRVDINIELPTKIDGITVSDSYKVSVPSNIHEIVNFANDFVNDVDEHRYFEAATLASMVRSNPESDAWMPVAGAIHECGEQLIRTRDQMIPALKQLIRYTISHVVWNAKPITVSQNLFFPINSAGGNSYDLNVEFAYPTSWDKEIERKFSSKPETLRAKARPVIPTVPVCMGTYSVLYSFQYPVIVSVKDKISDKYFRFAIYVSVKDNEADETCVADIFSGFTEYEKECMYNALCDFNITVKDSAGDPIESADVMFYNCYLGKTDSDGNLASSSTLKAPCMMADLEIFREGYRTYGEFISTVDMEDLDVVLNKGQGIVNLKIYGVPVTAKDFVSAGVFENYNVSGQKKDITEFKTEPEEPEEEPQSDIQVMLTFYPLESNPITGEDIQVIDYNINDEGEFVNEMSIDGLYPGEFAVTAIASKQSNQLTVGFFANTLSITEGDNSLFLYVPVVVAIDQAELETSISTEEVNKLNELATCFDKSTLITTTEYGDVRVGCEF